MEMKRFLANGLAIPTFSIFVGASFSGIDFRLIRAILYISASALARMASQKSLPAV
jgi:hypothetical protein